MKLRARALGLTLGAIFGIGVFMATLWAMLEKRGDTLSNLAGYCPGYNITTGGALIGLVWGIVYGFILGVLIAWLYNTFSKIIYKRETGLK